MTSPNTIIETNIERILEDTLWEEVKLIREKMKALQDEVAAHHSRMERLIRIADAANIPEPIYD